MALLQPAQARVTRAFDAVLRAVARSCEARDIDCFLFNSILDGMRRLRRALETVRAALHLLATKAVAPSWGETARVGVDGD